MSSSPVTVQLVSQNLTVGSVTPSITIPIGSTYATATFTSTNVTGTVSISAVASGFLSADKTVKTVLLPLKIQVTATPSSTYEKGQSQISILVTSNGTPVPNAAVAWAATFGSITNSASSTDQNGTATATYNGGSQPGTFFVRVSVSESGYASSSAAHAVTILAQAAPQKSNGFFSITLLFIPLWILIVVAASGSGTFGFLFIRKRRAAGAEETEEPGV